jgi:HlyD family secretion protein
MTKQRKWMIAVAAVCAAGLLVLIFRPDPVRVEVGTVQRGPLVVSVEEQGRTRARDRYTVAAPITGRLLRTEVDEGRQVVRGDVLATMAPPPEDPRTEATIRAELTAAEARLREAQAALAEAKTDEAQARREAERRADLFAQGTISIETHEKYAQAAHSARARLDTARASLRAARAEVDRARSRLLGIGADDVGVQDTMAPVRAPVSGTVLRVHEESERVVPAGTPLFERGKETGLELVIDLLTEEAVEVEAGDVIQITGWGGRNPLEGRVRYVEPQAFTEISALGVEEQRVNVIGDLIDPPASLGAGYRIEAAIVTWRGEDVLTVPTSAIFRQGGGWVTFVVEGTRARLRSIEIGRRGSERAEVLAGLEEADAVIVFPSDLVEEGVRVSVTPQLSRTR